jgi:hypothetical protein
MAYTSDEDLMNAATKYFYYKSAGAGSVTGQIDAADIADLNRQLTMLNDKISLAQTEEETYNEVYLNNQRNPKAFGLFSKWGLRTTQDWMFAYFYFSYIVFSVVLLGVSIKYSQNHLLTFTAVSGVLLFMGVMLTLMLFAYA